MMKIKFRMKTSNRTSFKTMICFRILMIALSTMKRRRHPNSKDHLRQEQYHMLVSCLKMTVLQIQKTCIPVLLNCRVVVSKQSPTKFRRKLNKSKTKNTITSNETRVGRKVIPVEVRLMGQLLILTITEELALNNE